MKPYPVPPHPNPLPAIEPAEQTRRLLAGKPSPHQEHLPETGETCWCNRVMFRSGRIEFCEVGHVKGGA